MTAKLKLAAYVVLIALAIWFGREFYSSYSKIVPPSDDPATNAAPGAAASTRPGATNPAAPLPAQAIVPLRASNTPAAPPAGAAAGNAAANSGEGGRPVGYLVLFVGALIALGVMITYDLTQFVGSRAVDYLFEDKGEGMRDPEYEQAEQAWVNGKSLEAIEMMREYLKKNPLKQYVALRIAEIYEKDFQNYVAASLEYEEILKKKLPAERWGWAAIHLCNLYARMGQQDKMRALLERLARDYPKTAAAKKARVSLGLPEPATEAGAALAAAPAERVEEQEDGEGKVFDLDEMIAAADEEESHSPPPEAAPETSSPAKPPKSSLPPGFRKKD